MIAVERDDQNLVLATSVEDVDRLNAKFYGKYPYPARAVAHDRLLDEDFNRRILCQNIGDWTHNAVPRAPKIWVAGCGTNQAVVTALAFPEGVVLGSDLSGPSLELCARSAKDTGARNLELRRESLNHVRYQEEFDLVLCTGVIHHNHDPGIPLQRLANALKPGAILELMVYNRFHRLMTSTFQKAVRLLGGSAGDPGSDRELAIAKALIADYPAECLMKQFVQQSRDATKESLADTFLEPVEHSYTVETFNDLAASCGLEIVAPCVNVFDRSLGRTSWTVEFRSLELQKQYDALDDLQRWQVTNLLLAERSPMLWFYLRRAGTGAPGRSEREICEQFLHTRFTQSQVARQRFVLGMDGTYRAAAATTLYPGDHPDALLHTVVQHADGRTPIGQILRSRDIPTSFPKVNATRKRLTTTAFPYLTAVH
jgi:SAM-dependent methyltransferase